MNNLYNRLFLFIILFAQVLLSAAQNTNFQTGSFIVNMGVSPQTIPNALKPYGMVYDLIRNYEVPVYWSINPNKLKDGTDFIYNGISYRGGPFIIAAENRNATVDARIAYWQTQGVVGVFSTSSFSAPVAQIITAVPRWTLDFKSGQIATSYLENAGIPGTNASFSDPYLLNSCNDIYVLPHADPQWDTHNFLINWNNTNKGAIWVSCHAVSVLENMFNPSNNTQQANFLALNSAGPGSPALVPFGTHKDGSVPFNNNSFPADPVMQFLGSVDQATTNGSEQIYLPANGGGWRPSTKVCVYDPTHLNVPSLSPGKAAVIAYGKAYGDNNRGWVMYEGGHNQDKGGEYSVAAQRAFLNFSYMATLQKSMTLNTSGIQSVMVSNAVYNLSTTILQEIPSGPYTIQWSSTCGGTFSNPTSLNTSFTAPVVGSPTNCVISVKVTDACNRKKFQTFTVLITNGPRPPLPLPDSLSFTPGCVNLNPEITIHPLANDVEPDSQPMTISSVTGSNGVWTVNPDQTVKFVPNPGFYGPTTANYSVCDNTTPTPICNSSTITITIGSINQEPVPVNDSYTILEDSSMRINVLANDAVGNGGGSLKIAGIAIYPLHGKLSINPDNTITYIPAADNRIADSFYYRVVNGGGYTATAKVTINYIADGCSPGYYQTCVPGPNPISIIATQDTYMNAKFPTANYGTADVIVVDRENTEKQRSLIKFTLPQLTCDPAVSPVINNAVLKLYKSAEGGGSLNVDVYRATSIWDEDQANWNNRLTSTAWTTAGGAFNSTLQATAVVNNDGLYTWNISSLVNNWYSDPTNYPNYGILLKTTEGGGDRDPNFVSSESTSGLMKPTLEISYTIPQLCVLIPIRPPLAMPDTARTNSLSAVNIDVTANDYFPNAGTKTVSVIPGSVSSGTASVSGNTIIYSPLSSFSGTASLQYRVVNNTTLLADTAMVYIFVSYTAPVANNDSSTILSGQNVTKDVTLNDIDPQTIGIIATVIAGPKNGIYSASGNTVTYTAPFNFIGRDTITYRLTNAGAGLCNEDNASDTAQYIIIVNNRSPIAVSDTMPTNPCQPITIDVLGNDADPENGSIRVNSVSAAVPPTAGTTSTDGSYIYFTPDPSFVGSSATFTYTIADDATPYATSNTATISVSLTNIINLPPVAINDTLNGLYESPSYINVLDDDSDPENDPLTVSLTPDLLQPAHGTISVNGNGLVQYIPNNGFWGKDSFDYKISDTHFGPSGAFCTSVSQTRTARVYILITNLLYPLSINEVQLTGSRQQQFNLLKWSILEKNIPFTCILEKSTDNRLFYPVTTIEQNNPGYGMRTYEFPDDQINTPAIYYRIKIINEGQLVNYSNTILIKYNGSSSQMLAYPLPFNNILTAKFFASAAGSIQAYLINMDGKVVQQKNIAGKKEENLLVFDNLAELPAGLYILTVQMNGQSWQQKIIKSQ